MLVKATKEVDSKQNYLRAEVGELKAVGVEPVELRGAELETYLKKTAKAQYDKFLADCPEYGPELLDMIKDYLVKVD